MKKDKRSELLVNNSIQDSKVSESIIDSGIEKNENFISGECKTNEPTTNCGAEISNDEKSYIITDDQLRCLYAEFTGRSALTQSLIKVTNNGDFWFEFESARDDYDGTNDEEFKREYENLRNSCNEDEIVIYDYLPFSIQEMLESIEERILIYCQENEDACYCGIDAELHNLLLLSDIVKQNIPESELND